MVNKAIGYGMPTVEFYQNVKLPVDPSWPLVDELDECLMGTDYVTGDGSDHRTIASKRGLSELFTPVGNDHIIIFPTITEKGQWYRRGDAIDQVAAMHDGQPSVEYLDTPFIHYNYYMDCNGVEVPGGGNGSTEPSKWHRDAMTLDPALVPGVPRIMRQWLTRYGIFDLSGVAKLRPMLAVWEVAW